MLPEQGLATYLRRLHQPADEQTLLHIAGETKHLLYTARNVIPHAQDPIRDGDLRWIHTEKNRALREWEEGPVSDGVALVIDDYLLARGLIDVQFPYAHLPRLTAWQTRRLHSYERATIITNEQSIDGYVAGIDPAEQQLIYADLRLDDNTIERIDTILTPDIRAYQPGVRTYD